MGGQQSTAAAAAPVLGSAVAATTTSTSTSTSSSSSAAAGGAKIRFPKSIKDNVKQKQKFCRELFDLLHNRAFVDFAVDFANIDPSSDSGGNSKNKKMSSSDAANESKDSNGADTILNSTLFLETLDDNFDDCSNKFKSRLMKLIAGKDEGSSTSPSSSSLHAIEDLDMKKVMATLVAIDEVQFVDIKKMLLNKAPVNYNMRPSRPAQIKLFQDISSFSVIFDTILAALETNKSKENEEFLSGLFARPLGIFKNTLACAEPRLLFGAENNLSTIPKTTVLLDEATVKASASPASAIHAISSQKSQLCWKSDFSKANPVTFSVDLKKSENICGIRIDYGPANFTNDVKVALPHSIEISIAQENGGSGEGGEVNAAATNECLTYEFSPFKMAFELCSWNQFYYFKVNNAKSIRVSFKSNSSDPSSRNLCVYNFEVFKIDEIKMVDASLPLLLPSSSLSSSPLPSACSSLINYAIKLRRTISFREHALDLIISSCSISASLSSMMKLLAIIIEDPAVLKHQSPAVNKLYDDINLYKCEVEELCEPKTPIEPKLVNNIDFNLPGKSGIHLSDADSTATSTNFSSDYSYCFGDMKMDHGVWEWTVTVTQYLANNFSNGGELHLGCCRYVEPKLLLEDPEAQLKEFKNGLWKLNLSNEKAYYKDDELFQMTDLRMLLTESGALVAPSVGATSAYAHAVKFRFDVSKGIIYTGTNYKPTFYNVPAGISPIVLFKKCGAKVKLSDIRQYKSFGSTVTASNIEQYLTAGTKAESGGGGIGIVDLETLIANYTKMCNCLGEYLSLPSLSSNSPNFEFCVELKWENFVEILSLLKLATSNHDQFVRASVLKCLLKIASLQFLCIKVSNFDFENFGFEYKFDKKSFSYSFEGFPSYTLIAEYKDFVASLHKISHADGEIQSLCNDILVNGSNLLFPNVSDKINLVLSNCSNVSDIGEARNSCCVNFLQELSDYSTTARIIDCLQTADIASSVADFEKKFSEFMKFVMKELSKSDSRILREQTSNTRLELEIQTNLRDILTNVLMRVVGSFARKNSDKMKSVLKMLCVEFLHYSEKFYRQFSAVKQESQFRHILHEQTYMGQTFPIFLQSLVFISDKSLAIEILPSLSEIICLLKDIFDADLDSLSDSFASPIRNKVVAGTKAPQLDFAFEENVNPGINISDDGQVFHCTVSNNELWALYRPTSDYFHESIEWSFHLLEDSSDDEHSLLGIARLGLTDRGYKSSPDAWLLRSYNGEIYHCGSSRVCFKLHQGDFLRCFYDHARGTFSMAKNDDPLAIIYSDIQGPGIVPFVGAYGQVKVKVVDFRISGGGGPVEACIKNWVSSDFRCHCVEFLSKSINSVDFCEAPKSVNSWSDFSNLANAQGAEILTCAPGQVSEWSFHLTTNDVKHFWRMGLQLTFRSNEGTLSNINFELRSFLATNADNIHIFIGKSFCEKSWSDGTVESGNSDLIKDLIAKQGTFLFQIKLDLIASRISCYVNGRIIHELNLKEHALFRDNTILSCRGDASLSHKSQKLILNIVCESTLISRLFNVATITFGQMTNNLTKFKSSDDKDEKEFSKWLESPLFSGGLDDRHLMKLPQNVFTEYFPSNSTDIDIGAVNLNESLTNKSSQIIAENDFLQRLSTDDQISLHIDEQASAFLEWLNGVRFFGKNDMLDNRFKKNGTYSFPCERPFIAALLRHSNLVKDALCIANSIVEKQSEPKADSPANCFVEIAKKLNSLRLDLRNLKQQAAGEEKPDLFIDFCKQLSERSIFLLNLRPAIPSEKSSENKDSSTPQFDQVIQLLHSYSGGSKSSLLGGDRTLSSRLSSSNSRSLSTESNDPSSPFSPEVIEKDDTEEVALFKACYEFARMGGDAHVKLKEIMLERYSRSLERFVVLNSIKFMTSIMKTANISRLRKTLTALIYSSLQAICSSGFALAGSSTRFGRRHYLSGLEGTGKQVLSGLASAFNSTFICVVDELRLSIDSFVEAKVGEMNSISFQTIKLLLGAVLIDFSNDDFKIVIESNIFEQIDRLASLSIYEKVSLQWSKVAKDYVCSLLQLQSADPVNVTNHFLTSSIEPGKMYGATQKSSAASNKGTTIKGEKSNGAIKGMMSLRGDFINAFEKQVALSSWSHESLKFSLPPLASISKSGGNDDSHLVLWSPKLVTRNDFFLAFCEINDYWQNSYDKFTDMRSTPPSDVYEKILLNLDLLTTDLGSIKGTAQAEGFNLRSVRGKNVKVTETVKSTVELREDAAYYFEIEVVSFIGESLAVGLCTSGFSSGSGFIGKNSDKSSFGYVSSGAIQGAHKIEEAKVFENFSSGDIIGCGIKQVQQESSETVWIVYFTKNGKLLGDAFTLPSSKFGKDKIQLYPCVSVLLNHKDERATFRLNNGVVRFEYADVEYKIPPVLRERRKEFVTLQSRIRSENEEDTAGLPSFSGKYSIIYDEMVKPLSVSLVDLSVKCNFASDLSEMASLFQSYLLSSCCKVKAEEKANVLNKLPVDKNRFADKIIENIANFSFRSISDGVEFLQSIPPAFDVAKPLKRLQFPGTGSFLLSCIGSADASTTASGYPIDELEGILEKSEVEFSITKSIEMLLRLAVFVMKAGRRKDLLSFSSPKCMISLFKCLDLDPPQLVSRSLLALEKYLVNFVPKDIDNALQSKPTIEASENKLGMAVNHLFNKIIISFSSFSRGFQQKRHIFQIPSLVGEDNETVKMSPPSGYGKSLLSLADLSIQVLQTLMKSDIFWRNHLVSYLSNGLLEAIKLLERRKVPDDTSPSINFMDFTADEWTILQTSCAVAAVISGLSEIRFGSVVMHKNSTNNIVLSSYECDKKDGSKAFKVMKKVGSKETTIFIANRSDLKLVQENFSNWVDISPPITEFIVKLTGTLLTTCRPVLANRIDGDFKFLNSESFLDYIPVLNAEGGEKTASALLKSRWKYQVKLYLLHLLPVFTSTFASLYSSNFGLVDSAMQNLSDVNLLELITKLSAADCMSALSKLPFVHDMWLDAHALGLDDQANFRLPTAELLSKDSFGKVAHIFSTEESPPIELKSTSSTEYTEGSDQLASSEENTSESIEISSPTSDKPIFSDGGNSDKVISAGDKKLILEKTKTSVTYSPVTSASTSSGGSSAGNSDAAAADQTLTIKVKDNSDDVMHFKVKKTMKLMRVFEAYASRKSVPLENLVFLFNGIILEPLHTALFLKLEDGNQIDVVPAIAKLASTGDSNIDAFAAKCADVLSPGFQSPTLDMAVYHDADILIAYDRMGGYSVFDTTSTETEDLVCLENNWLNSFRIKRQYHGKKCKFSFISRFSDEFGCPIFEGVSILGGRPVNRFEKWCGLMMNSPVEMANLDRDAVILSLRQICQISYNNNDLSAFNYRAVAARDSVSMQSEMQYRLLKNVSLSDSQNKTEVFQTMLPSLFEQDYGASDSLPPPSSSTNQSSSATGGTCQKAAFGDKFITKLIDEIESCATLSFGDFSNKRLSDKPNSIIESKSYPSGQTEEITVGGLLNVDPQWKKTVITFDEMSRTNNSLAWLKFYTSKDDYNRDKSWMKMSGPRLTKETQLSESQEDNLASLDMPFSNITFRNFMLFAGRPVELYYRYSFKPGSFRSAVNSVETSYQKGVDLQIKASRGVLFPNPKTFLEEQANAFLSESYSSQTSYDFPDFISVSKTKKKVDTAWKVKVDADEDNSLFGLFNEPEGDSDHSDSSSSSSSSSAASGGEANGVQSIMASAEWLNDIGTITCSIDGLKSGVWYFEVGFFEQEINQYSSSMHPEILIGYTHEESQTQVCFNDYGVPFKDQFDPHSRRFFYPEKPIDRDNDSRLMREVFNAVDSRNFAECNRLVCQGLSVLASIKDDGSQLDIWLARNGDWDDCRHIQHMSTDAGVSWKPLIGITSNLSFYPNYGLYSFKHIPSEDFLSSVGIDSFKSIQETNELKSATGIVNRFRCEISCQKSSVFKKCTKFRQVHDFKDTNPLTKLKVWRPVPPADFAILGDIISEFPPVATLVVSKASSKAATGLESIMIEEVQGALKHSFCKAVTPNEDYCCLGDFFNDGILTAKDIGCVPIHDLATTSRVPVFDSLKLKVKGSGPSPKDLSIVYNGYRVCNYLNTFVIERKDVKLKMRNNQASSCYKIKDLTSASLLIREWFIDSDLAQIPCLSWINSTIQILLKHFSSRGQEFSRQLLDKLMGSYANLFLSPQNDRSFACIPTLLSLVKFWFRLNNNDSIVPPLMTTLPSGLDKLISSVLFQSYRELTKAKIGSSNSKKKALFSNEYLSLFHFSFEVTTLFMHQLPLLSIDSLATFHSRYIPEIRRSNHLAVDVSDNVVNLMVNLIGFLKILDFEILENKTLNLQKIIESPDYFIISQFITRLWFTKLSRYFSVECLSTGGVVSMPFKLKFPGAEKFDFSFDPRFKCANLNLSLFTDNAAVPAVTVNNKKVSKKDSKKVGTKIDVASLYTTKLSFTDNVFNISSAAAEIDVKSKPDTDVEPFWGSEYIQFDTSGMASYHFDGCDDCYISYAAAPPSWRHDDGTRFPESKQFINPKYDPATRIFTGSIDWSASSVGGCVRWEYRMIFSSDFAIISDGEVTSVKKNGSKKVSSRFSVDLSYKRVLAAVDEEDAIADSSSAALSTEATFDSMLSQTAAGGGAGPGLAAEESSFLSLQDPRLRSSKPSPSVHKSSTGGWALTGAFDYANNESPKFSDDELIYLSKLDHSAATLSTKPVLNASELLSMGNKICELGIVVHSGFVCIEDAVQLSIEISRPVLLSDEFLYALKFNKAISEGKSAMSSSSSSSSASSLVSKSAATPNSRGIEAKDNCGCDPKDIDLVISQATCSREVAILALLRNNQDIVNAIMDLMMGDPLPDSRSHSTTTALAGKAVEPVFIPKELTMIIDDPNSPQKVSDESKSIPASVTIIQITGKSHSIVFDGHDRVSYSLFALRKPDIATEEIQVKEPETEKAAAVIPPKKIEPDVPEGMWMCPMCTFNNTDDNDTCEVCMSPKAGSSKAARWQCHACSSFNETTSLACTVCETPLSIDHNPFMLEFMPSREEEEYDEVEEGGPGRSKPSDKSKKDEKATSIVIPPIELSDGTRQDFIKISTVGTLTQTNKICHLISRNFNLNAQSTESIKVTSFTPRDVILSCLNSSMEIDTILLDHISATYKAKLQISGASFDHLEKIDHLPVALLEKRASAFSSMSLLDIKLRLLLLTNFNKSFFQLLPLLDLSNLDAKSLGSLLRKYRQYLILELKMPMINEEIKALQSSKSEKKNLIFDNIKASYSTDRKLSKPSNSENIFCQAYRQLKPLEVDVWRYSEDHVFRVNFVNEQGTDAGGVYREAMSRIIEDLFSTNFELLLPCANAKWGKFDNMDKFVPNSSLCDDLSVDMFKFIGKMMALSLRVRLCLVFEFPPLIWKKFTYEDVTISDLEAIDADAVTNIHSILACDEETFKATYSTLDFSYVTVGGDKRFLKKDSTSRVTFATRSSYCDLLVKAKLNEFDEQINAIRSGFFDVLPCDSLMTLCSSSQIEFLVCGSAVIDFDSWKSSTTYSPGFSEDLKALFWKVVATFTSEEWTRLLRFAWGRSRFPPLGSLQYRNMSLSQSSCTLPKSHTCSFNIEIPQTYATEEDMRKGLLIAINFGLGGILNG